MLGLRWGLLGSLIPWGIMLRWGLLGSLIPWGIMLLVHGDAYGGVALQVPCMHLTIG